MQHLDLQVIDQAMTWSLTGRCVWLCTVLKTFGSSPRVPGAMMVACDDGAYHGSLSGGCIEDDFLSRLKKGEFQHVAKIIQYGDSEFNDNASDIQLPCGGKLDVLVECLMPTNENQQHLQQLQKSLQGQASVTRLVDLKSQTRALTRSVVSTKNVEVDVLGQQVRIDCGPVARLIIAGYSSVSVFCAQYAQMMGYDVILCDHREELLINLNIPNIKVVPVFPPDFINQPSNVHENTAIVSLTHDPRVDDLAMMDAVNTSAFYIGVMGAERTSQNRVQRLLRSGELTDRDLDRIHMPIGLKLGSKTPAEIALAVMADILRVRNGIAKADL